MTDGSVQSADGTVIGLEQSGSGPALIMMGGALDRIMFGSWLPSLAEHFTVLAVDRRASGGGADGGPVALERELDDIVAVLDAASLLPRPVTLYGHASAAVLALEAAARWLPVDRVAVYEPAYLAEDGTPPRERLAMIVQPVLVLAGNNSPGWVQASARAVAGAIRTARLATLGSGTHKWTAADLAAELVRFVPDPRLTGPDVPDAVRRLVGAINAEDARAFLACFAPGAVVDDWGRIFEGRAAIAEWNARGNAATRTRVAVTGDSPAEQTRTFTITVTGDGYNGPATFAVTISDGLITRLTIG